MLRMRAVQQVLQQPDEPQVPAVGGAPAPVTRLVYSSPAGLAAADPQRKILPLRALSFLVVVAFPVAIASVYYFAVAADQYVTEFRMTLRQADTPRVEGLLLGDVGHGAVATESQIVVQFIASRAIVDELDPSLDLRKLFSPPSADWWARLHAPASIEQLVYYWNEQVDPFYDTSTGTIVVRLRAFSATDSLRLAQAVVASSEHLVNELSVRARRDAVGRAETEVTAAEQRLLAALDKERQFRDKVGLIDPGKAADANAQLTTNAR
jgi:capsular polysaccharide transport system permease protein